MNRANSDTGWVRNPDGSLGWTLNPITGCLNHTDGLCKGGLFPCYAYRLAHGRLSKRYLAYDRIYEDALGYNSQRNWADPFCPRFWPSRFEDDLGICRGIFLCDMSDLFGVGIPEAWTSAVIDRIKRSSHRNRYYLLTKQPQNLPRWSPFPDNCYVGATVCNKRMADDAGFYLWEVEAGVLYISFEPLLERIPGIKFISDCEVKNKLGWLIIGACTGTKAEMTRLIEIYPELTVMPFGSRYTAQPKIEWVREIVGAADDTGIPVFLKDNLKSLLPIEPPFYKAEPVPLNQVNWPQKEWDWYLRQEWPGKNEKAGEVKCLSNE